MLEKIAAMLSDQLNVDESSITLDTRFKEDLGADSLDLFELVMNLEEEYNIEIPAEELADLTTVGLFLNYISAKGIEL
ncbi:MAG: acyl carrier protein [Lachnospiraceae bacterium]|nr:acyl carrier protein [Lachnospiraceae bacterium]